MKNNQESHIDGKFLSNQVINDDIKQLLYLNKQSQYLNDINTQNYFNIKPYFQQNIDEIQNLVKDDALKAEFCSLFKSNVKLNPLIAIIHKIKTLFDKRTNE